MMMRVAWAVLFVCGCGVALVRGATPKDNPSGVDTARVRRQSVYRPDFFNLNKIADNIIKLVTEDVVYNNKATVSLPNVHEDSTFSLGFFKVPYEVRASGGTAGDLTTFRRSGDIVSTKNFKEDLLVDVPVTLDRLRVHYGYYNLKVIGLDITGELEGTMDKVSFRVVIYGKEKGLGCTAALTDVKVAGIGKISVNITGFRNFNGIVSSIVETFMESRQLGIVSTVERILLKELRVVLEEYDCDQYNSLFLLGEY